MKLVRKKELCQKRAKKSEKVAQENENEWHKKQDDEEHLRANPVQEVSEEKELLPRLGEEVQGVCGNQGIFASIAGKSKPSCSL